MTIEKLNLVDLTERDHLGGSHADDGGIDQSLLAFQKAITSLGKRDQNFRYFSHLN